MIRKILALAALSTLTACDYLEKIEFEKERSDQVYRVAMEDYRAGRLAQAIEGLNKVLAADPTNSSARFQLACLLQDTKKDYLGAVCAYREYLLQEPTSDKAQLARERIGFCEKGLAIDLANKYELNHVETERRLNAELRESIKNLEKTKVKLTKDIGDLMRRYTELTEENARLKGLMAAEAHEFDDKTDSVNDIADAKRMLEEPDEEGPAATADIADAKSLLDEDDEEGPLATAEVAEAKTLLDEPAPEGPIIKQPVDAKEKRAAAEAAQREAAEKERARLASLAPQHEARPDKYVVQDGDTLYKIAVRFYGVASRWTLIRDANKAIVSTDGRIKKGQTLVLPPEPAN